MDVAARQEDVRIVVSDRIANPVAVGVIVIERGVVVTGQVWMVEVLSRVHDRDCHTVIRADSQRGLGVDFPLRATCGGVQVPLRRKTGIGNGCWIQCAGRFIAFREQRYDFDSVSPLLGEFQQLLMVTRSIEFHFPEVDTNFVTERSVCG